MTNEDIIFNSLKNCNCQGYLLFSYMVSARTTKAAANKTLKAYLEKFLFMRLMRGLYITPVFIPKDIKRIKEGVNDTTLDSDVSLLYVYVDREDFLKNCNFYWLEAEE